MARHHRHDKVSKKIKAKFPQIYVDKDADFASIKIAAGNEAKSYVRDGFVFCEDDKGQIIEIQVLNLSLLKKIYLVELNDF